MTVRPSLVNTSTEFGSTRTVRRDFPFSNGILTMCCLLNAFENRMLPDLERSSVRVWLAVS